MSSILLASGSSYRTRYASAPLGRMREQITVGDVYDVGFPPDPTSGLAS